MEDYRYSLQIAVMIYTTLVNTHTVSFIMIKTYFNSCLLYSNKTIENTDNVAHLLSNCDGPIAFCNAKSRELYTIR